MQFVYNFKPINDIDIHFGRTINSIALGTNSTSELEESD